MKVIALNGSPKKNGNTALLLNTVCEVFQEEGIETSIIHLPPLKLQPCTGCFKCRKTKDGKCHGVTDDTLNDVLAQVIEAEGMLIGSPVWFSNVTGHVKNFIDRAGMVVRMNDHLLSRKVGAAVVAVRRAGGIPTFDAINHFFHISGVVVPGSHYWNVGVGGGPGECRDDAEGIETMRVLGRNMAWVLKKLNA
ncbi:MAG: flavodoxin family protein [Candidatus Lernaella stagnicola]|nr:flavodoxin family protein [Candidatus Lernaella stagnicola]